MPTIAYLTSADLLPGGDRALSDRRELDHQWGALSLHCAARGLHLALWLWDDPALLLAARVGQVDAVLVGTTWDYQHRVEAFLDRMEALSAHVPVLNPPAVLRWNARKTYLRDLESAGVPVVPTAWVEAVDEAAVAAAFQALGGEELVAKPLVGANAVRQVRLRRGQPLPPPAALPPAAALIQPFLPAVQAEGELSFVFCGGVLSHALCKRPAPGDYRVQATYGGEATALQPTAAQVQAAHAVLQAIPQAVPGAAVPLYARVDLVRGPEDGLLVMELELIEPYLYPLQGPELGARFAAALVAALAAQPPSAASSRSAEARSRGSST